MKSLLDNNIRNIISSMKTIAVVGLSPKESRPSNMVARYLLEAGYTIIPVNPGQDEILGMTCYPDLNAVPVPVDIVTIFRRSDAVPAVIEQAIQIGAKAVWMQVGVINEKAADLARKAGLAVVMDRCLKMDHQSM